VDYSRLGDYAVHIKDCPVKIHSVLFPCFSSRNQDQTPNALNEGASTFITLPRVVPARLLKMRGMTEKRE
jgi:hypothetical protein